MKPERLKDDSGEWIRRDVFVNEIVDEEDVGAEKIEELLDEMISDGPMRSTMVGDTEYVQLSSRLSGVQAMAKYKARSMRNKATNVLGGSRRFRD